MESKGSREAQIFELEKDKLNGVLMKENMIDIGYSTGKLGDY